MVGGYRYGAEDADDWRPFFYREPGVGDAGGARDLREQRFSLEMLFMSQMRFFPKGPKIGLLISAIYMYKTLLLLDTEELLSEKAASATINNTSFSLSPCPPLLVVT